MRAAEHRAKQESREPLPPPVPRTRTDLRPPRCPGGRTLRACSVERVRERFALRFRGSRHICSSCSKRAECAPSSREKFAKSVKLTLTDQEVRFLAGPEAPDTPLAPAPASSRRIRFARGGTRLLPPQTDNTALPSSFQAQAPYLVPTTLRDRLLTLCTAVVLYIIVPIIPNPIPKPDYFAMTPAERQRRRKTWDALIQWNALPDDLLVHLEFACTGATSQREAVARLVRPCVAGKPDATPARNPLRQSTLDKPRVSPTPPAQAGSGPAPATKATPSTSEVAQSLSGPAAAPTLANSS